jgi:hypothetical protein
MTLKITFEQAMGFLPTQASALSIHQETLVAYAKNEAAAGRINIGGNGITPGMNTHVLALGTGFLAQWREARTPFDLQIQPYIHDIQALDDAKRDAEKLKRTMPELTAQIKERAAAVLAYTDAEKKLEETKRQYERMKGNEGGREAVQGAYGFLYWPALLLIGVTEWLINYDTFFLFLNVPAIAAGVTIILGVLLAFAAHGHGTLFKQWSYRFGAHRKDTERRGEWRFFILSTFSLLLVLLAAGGSRYASVMRTASSSMGLNILGDAAVVQSNPVRDVSLSLLANLGAWAVGVFLAYLLHDENPIYMRAARDFKKAYKTFAKLNRKHVEDEIIRQHAVMEKEIEGLLASAAEKNDKVKEQFEMWTTVNKREEEIKETVASVMENGLGLYRNVLMQINGVQLAIEGRVVTSEEYATVPLVFE